MSVHYTDHVEMGVPVATLRDHMSVCVPQAGLAKIVKQVNGLVKIKRIVFLIILLCCNINKNVENFKN